MKTEQTVKDPFDLSLIIPLYNEEEVLAQILKDLLIFQTNFEQEEKRRLEVIVVNDGSTDNTGKILCEFASCNPGRVHILENEMNIGYGAALKKGILHASYPIIGIIDGDGTYRIEQCRDIFKAMREKPNCDMVVGDRHQKGKGNIPLIRRFPKWVLKKLAEFLVGMRIPDLNSGLRLMKKELVMQFFDLLPEGFSFTTTITLAFMTSHYKVVYLPINYDKRVGISSIRPIHDTLVFFQLIIRTVLYFNPLRVFLPISLLFIFLSISILLGSYLSTFAVDTVLSNW